MYPEDKPIFIRAVLSGLLNEDSQRIVMSKRFVQDVYTYIIALESEVTRLKDSWTYIDPARPETLPPVDTPLALSVLYYAHDQERKKAIFTKGFYRMDGRFKESGGWVFDPVTEIVYAWQPWPEPAALPEPEVE